MVKFSIGICTYNRINTLQKCLSALDVYISERDDCEVIVINNNSTDSTEEILKNINGIKVYNEYNQGLSFARNRFISESVGEYLLFLDDDAIICSDIIEMYSKAIFEFPEASIFGGRVLPELDVKKPTWFDSNFHMAYSILDLGGDSKVFHKPHGPLGANFLIKKDIIKLVRFRTDLGRVGNILLSGEETDFIIRLGLDKICVYVGEATVFHHFQQSRYSKAWAFERFKQNGVSDYIMRKENDDLMKGFLSQSFHFIKSFKTINKAYIKCRFLSLFSYFKMMV